MILTEPFFQASAPVHGAANQRIAPRCRRTHRGFTLIEMMVVIGIIVILAGITIVVGVQVKRYSEEKVTNSTLVTLQKIMGQYLKASNAEPTMNTTFAGNPTATYNPTTNTPAPSAWQADLLAFDRTAVASLPTNSTGLIIDGYGNPIQYLPTGWFYNGSKFVQSSTQTGRPPDPGHFVSYGPDGKFEPGTSSDDAYSPDVNYETQ